jgi:uncharacterized protein with HEPN domain
MKFHREDFMPKNKKRKRVSLKPVVKAIARTTKQLKKIRKNASPAEKKILDPKIKAVEILGDNARKICKVAGLSI